MLFIIGGASGAGKTSCLAGLRDGAPDINWHDFDALGVPVPPVPPDWRARTTEGWLQRALANQQRGQDTGIAGRAVYGEVLACPSAERIDGICYCLLDCDDVVRIDRIRQSGGSPDAASQDMLSWAAWLRMHAIDPAWRPDVIRDPAACFSAMRFDRWVDWQRGDSRWRVHKLDTSRLSVAQAVDEIISWIDSERERRQPKPSVKNAATATIRPIRVEDAPRWVALTNALVTETPFMMREPDEPSPWQDRAEEFLTRLHQRTNATIFVVEAANELVGWLSARGGEFRRNQGKVHLVLGIRQAWTGQGLGRRLLAGAEAWARGWGAHRLELTVIATNHRARRLYERVGFVYEGRQVASLRGDGRLIDEFIMAKILNAGTSA